MYMYFEFSVLLLMVIFIKCINCLETLINEEEEFCSIENQNNCVTWPTNPIERNVHQHPGIHYNVIIENIHKAKDSYTNCSQDLEDNQCECYADVIRKDLSIFQTTGITREMLEMATRFGTHYKVYKQKLFRNSKCMFPARCEGIEHFLLRLLPQLPDMELVINTRDWPQIPIQQQILPVFSFSKTVNYADIMYPAWTFWAGGPAITLYPTGIGRWDLHRKNLSKAAELYTWDLKSAKGFFRGSRTSDERDALVMLSRKKFDLVDAQYTKNQAWKSPKDTLNAEPAKEVSFEDHCKYKYLFNFRGVAASFRLKHLFLCKSLVIHVGDEWLEFFYPALKPWMHYVPLDKYPTGQDIEKIIAFFKMHDDLAKEIAGRGYEFIWQHLRMSDVECYWKRLLNAYSQLIKFKVESPESDMVEITHEN